LLLLLAVVVSTAISTTTAAALVSISTITATVPTIVVLRRVLFETLVLLFHIVEQIFAKCLGLLNIVGIRTTCNL
jgi:hypothetical protein